MSKFLCLLFLCVCTTLFAQTPKPAGINLSGVVDWSTELVFTDAFKQSREWKIGRAHV